MAMINRRVKVIIQFRRATESEWIEKNPILRPGEPALSIDKGLIKVGDGIKNWSSLPYSSSNGISIVAVNGIDLTPDVNKRVNIIVPTKTSDLVNDLRYATIEYVNENGGKIDNINVNGIRQEIINKTVDLVIPTKTSELLNNSGFITGDDIPSIPTKVSELFNDVGYITITSIPTKVSELDNDSHFISQETDPTVPAWAKQTNKPTYTASEVGALPDDTVIPTKLSELLNDDGYLKVTDLGVVDGEQYEWDIEAFLNTLQETGSYIFLWDEFKYFVDIKAVEVDGTTTVQQIFWGTEEGSSLINYRNLMIENGEILSTYTTNYLTFDEANSAFARNTHVHVRFAAQAQSIWDYCNTVALQNANPFVIYFDLSTNKTYLIETFVGNRQPVYKMQKVTEMNDTSYFCQRSSYYYSGQEHWGNWYKFTGEAFTPPTGR